MDQLEQRSFAYFPAYANAKTGLVRNTSESNSPASITALGAFLSVIPIGIERGWISREEGYRRAQRILTTMRHRLPHEHGCFYHFLDAKTGQRTWHSEVSCIDTAIAVAGALTVGAYFRGTDVERLADAVYARVDWPWFLDGEDGLQWGWKPESGFEGGPINFSEGILAYLLAMGSSTHPIPATAWDALWRPIGRYAGQTIVFTRDGALFAYLLPLAWLDLRNQHDAYVDYWTNAKQAILANRQFCLDNQQRFATYREGFWGLSAALGPGGYRAYGAKPGVVVHDGTVAPYAVVMAIPVAPEVAIPTCQRMRSQFDDRVWRRYGFTDAFNLDRRFFCDHYIALDEALMLLMVENHRTGLIWRFLSGQPAVQRALSLAGFSPGAQAEPTHNAERRGHSGAQTAIHRLQRPVAIDGDIAEWIDREPLELTPTRHRNVEFGYVRSTADASLYAYLGWDDERLYVAGVANDDEIVTTHRGSAIYVYDCIEVFFDFNRDGFLFGGHSADDVQVGLAPGGPDGAPQTWAWGTLNRQVTEAQSAVQVRDGGYRFELSIPWSVLGHRPAIGEPFGFTVMMHDRDRDGKAAKLAWSIDKETDPERLYFGEARLVP